MTLTAGDDVTINGAVSAKTDVTVTTDGDLTLVSTVIVVDGNPEAVGARVTAEGVVALTGAQNVTAAEAASVTGAGVTIEATDADATIDGNVAATGGNVEVTAGGALTVAGTAAATKDADGTGNVTLTAGTRTPP